MSAGAMVQAGCVAALGGVSELTAFDAPPVRAALPYAVVGEAVLGDWSAVGVRGREGRLAVMLFDGGERPVRLRRLVGEVEERLPALSRALGEGWRVAQLRLVRSRMARDGPDRWIATVEFQVRMYREDA